MTGKHELQDPRKADEAAPSLNESSEPVLGLPVDRATAMLPADMLEGGEIILLLLKPSLWFVLLSSLRVIAAVTIAFGLLYYAVVALQWLTVDPRQIVATAVALITVRLAWGFADWMGRTYVLTDRRVVRICGVVRVGVFQCPLSKLQHTEVYYPLRERLLGLGTISFASAGTGYPEAYWFTVARPMSVHREILVAVERYG